MGRTKKTPTKYPFILQKENSYFGDLLLVTKSEFEQPTYFASNSSHQQRCSLLWILNRHLNDISMLLWTYFRHFKKIIWQGFQKSDSQKNSGWLCSEHLIQHTLEMQPFESCSIQKVTMVKVVVMVILVGPYIVLSMESLRNISNLHFVLESFRNIKKGASSSWSSSLCFPLRISDEMTIGKANPTLVFETLAQSL